MIRNLLLHISFWILGSTLAHAESRQIQLEGFSKEDAQIARKKMENVFSSGASLSEIDELIKLLFQSNHYDLIEAVEDGTKVVVTGHAVRKISKITLEGVSSLKESDILNIANVSVGQKLMLKETSEIEKNIANYYQKEGFFSAHVKVQFVEETGGQVRIQIDVNEGPPAALQAISIETTNPVLKRELQQIAKSYLGKPFGSTTPENIREKVLDHFSENRYLNAQLGNPEIQFSKNKDSVSLKFDVDNPYQYLIFYYGNVQVESTSLSRYLRLNTTDRFGNNPASELAERVRVAYQKLGFANVKVIYEEEVLSQKYIKKLRFNIQEGKKVRIKEVEVQGRLTKPYENYSRFIKSHSGDLVDLGYYNGEDLNVGYKNLIVHLQNEGFLQAKLISSRTEFSKTGEFASIRVLIDEGPQTFIKEIKFKGLTAYSKSQMLEVIGFKEGDALKLTPLEESLLKIQEYYSSRGYLDIQLQNNPEDLVKYSNDNTQANIEFELNEGPQVYVGSIIVQGNDFTHTDVILREIDFKPGDLLTSGNMKESEFRLQRLGLFSGIDIRMLEKNSNISSRTVIIEVGERNPGLFNLGGAVNNDLGNQLGMSATAYTGIGYKNLSGTARAVSTRAEVSENLSLEPKFLEHDINAGYLEPFVLNQRIRGRINFNRSVHIFKSEFDKKIALEKNQISTLLERDLSQTVKFTWNLWSFAYSRKFNFPEDPSRTNEEKLQIANLGPTLDWDLRDNPLNTTRGMQMRFSGEYGTPALGSSSSVNYYKTNGMLKTFTPIHGPKWVWANQFGGGYIRNLLNPVEGRVPEEVMFSLGGRSSIRGFEAASLPPRNEFNDRYYGDSTHRDSYMFVPVDSHYYLIKTEIRFPIAGDLGGVLFYDGGAVKISGITFDDEYRDAAGFGFRYNTPVGPVSAEFAWKLDAKDLTQFNSKEPPFRFHFSIGAF